MDPNQTSGISSEAWMARLDERLHMLEEKVDVIDRKLDNKFVTQQEFKPIKALVYGGTGLILTSVMLALIAMVIRSG